ncbi:MAG: hypothetical protein AB1403_21035 [Candidatus Riflebacteria bacterium]
MISRLSLLYLAVFAIYSLIVCAAGISVWQCLQQLLIVILIVLRVKTRKPLFFIPDLFLFALPYFWLVSLYPSVSYWFSGWKLPFLGVFALSLLTGLPLIRQIDSTIRYGTILAATFILLYAIMLHRFFPVFDLGLFRNIVLNCAAFFCGLPVCYLAWQNLISSNEWLE